jgi:hypothetical protein
MQQFSSSVIQFLNGLEFLYPENVTVSQLKRTLHKFPEVEYAMVDAYSLGQLKSKKWMVENLPNDMGIVFICAGWFGTLAGMMFEHIPNKFEKIRSFDIDPSCADVADNINRPYVMDGWKFKASTLDIRKMTYPTTHETFRANGTSLELTEMPNTIINTSCEHIEDFTQWYDNIPPGTIVALQNNNYYEHEQHINCVANLQTFAEQTPMHVFYEGELSLTKYTRFMRIGMK